MIKMSLIPILLLLGGCTVHLKSDTKHDDKSVYIEKEIYVGPQVGKN